MREKLSIHSVTHSSSQPFIQPPNYFHKYLVSTYKAPKPYEFRYRISPLQFQNPKSSEHQNFYNLHEGKADTA